MWILYDIAFLVFSFLSLPRLLKRQWRRTLSERLGQLPSSLHRPFSRPRLWLHAVSVGEALALRPLIEGLRQEFCGMQCVFSTTTLTGRGILEKLRHEEEPLFYFPLDFHCVTRRVLRQIRPSLFVMMETELWPNLLLELRRQRIPAVLVNGRLSNRSFRTYRWIRWLMKPALQGLSLCCMQTEEDARRMKALGVSKEKIRIVGNLKFDASRFQNVTGSEALRRRLGLQEGESLWVAGSTHRGEEEEILEVFRLLRSRYPNLKLLLAPRHPERSREVARLSEEKKLPSRTLSQANTPVPSSVLILDTVGELLPMYQLATVVFVGGSLIPHGGQNPLEPAFFARPILFGPHMENFQDIATLFLKREAAYQVRNRSELAQTMQRLLEKEEERLLLGQKAKQLVAEQQGATERTLEYLREFAP